MPFAPDLRAPVRFETDEYVLRPITVADAELDHAAVVATREHLRLWEQSSWPDDDFTVEANRDDLERMERRHLAGEAFGFTMLAPDEHDCLGCVYVFPHDARFLASADVAPLGDVEWDAVAAAVYFWVRADRMDDGLDRRLLADLKRWFADVWGLEPVVFVTSESFTQQLDLLHSTDLEPRFEIREPDKPAPYLAFG
jgi:hypothetical protein